MSGGFEGFGPRKVAPVVDDSGRAFFVYGVTPEPKFPDRSLGTANEDEQWHKLLLEYDEARSEYELSRVSTGSHYSRRSFLMPYLDEHPMVAFRAQGVVDAFLNDFGIYAAQDVAVRTLNGDEWGDMDFTGLRRVVDGTEAYQLIPVAWRGEHGLPFTGSDIDAMELHSHDGFTQFVVNGILPLHWGGDDVSIVMHFRLLASFSMEFGESDFSFSYCLSGFKGSFEEYVYRELPGAHFNIHKPRFAPVWCTSGGRVRWSEDIGETRPTRRIDGSIAGQWIRAEVDKFDGWGNLPGRQVVYRTIQPR